MEFDQFGDVQACCANALYPLGNVRDLTLEQIWHGERAAALRAALRRHDYSFGCTVCRHRLQYGYGELPRDYYDNFPMSSLDPAWPYSLQFSLQGDGQSRGFAAPDRGGSSGGWRIQAEAVPEPAADRPMRPIDGLVDVTV